MDLSAESRGQGAAAEIRIQMARVAELRRERDAQPALARATAAVKRFQARRFAHTYADLLDSGTYAAPSRFFLEELYSERDFADRDVQFARIAGALERIFPKAVVATAMRLADLHGMTEELDHRMGVAWLALGPEGAGASLTEPDRYASCWRRVGRDADRHWQLQTVLSLGRDMARLTCTPGLRTLLRMMRAPAAAAGMSALQAFLEAGFDTFGAMARVRGAADAFLQVIDEREQRLMQALFRGEPERARALLPPS